MLARAERMMGELDEVRVGVSESLREPDRCGIVSGAVEDQGRRGEVCGSCGPVERAERDAAWQADCACQWGEGEPRGRKVPGGGGQSASGAVGLDDFGPVEDG